MHQFRFSSGEFGLKQLAFIVRLCIFNRGGRFEELDDRVAIRV